MARTAQLHAQDNQAQQVQQEQKVERARYEVQLAQRPYDSVDPQNRLVARELERRFEQALAELEAVAANTSERLQELEAPLSPAEELKKTIRDIAL
jgi:translation initiation factor 2 alpha subunit (eIF-2alpha)